MFDDPKILILAIIVITIAPLLILPLEFVLENWLYVGVIIAAIVVYFIASKFIFKRGVAGGKAFHNIP